MTDKIVFLDRDGTLNVDVPYCPSPSKFKLFPDVGESIKLLNESGFRTILITNQSGIARGFFTEADLEQIHNKMRLDLSDFEAKIDDIFYCKCLPGEDCENRKPNIGLFIKASQKYPLDKTKSYMIGDSDSDIEAGNKFGLKTIQMNRDSNFSGNANFETTSLIDAVRLII